MITIDPGMKGAIVEYLGDKVVPHNMPKTMTEIIDLLIKLRCIHDVCVIEHTGKYMPGNSGPASVKFARHCGNLDASLYCLKYKTIEVTPAKWQKVIIGLDKDKNKRKRQIKDAMQRRFPEIKVTLTNADALGILVWYLERRK